MTNSDTVARPTETLDFKLLEVIERDIGGLEYFIVPVGGMISDDLASGIIDRDDYTPEQMRVWARLFAAAPDLLAAARALFAATGDPGNQRKLEDARFAVLAAIRKTEAP